MVQHQLLRQIMAGRLRHLLFIWVVLVLQMSVWLFCASLCGARASGALDWCEKLLVKLSSFSFLQNEVLTAALLSLQEYFLVVAEVRRVILLLNSRRNIRLHKQIWDLVWLKLILVRATVNRRDAFTLAWWRRLLTLCFFYLLNVLITDLTLEEWLVLAFLSANWQKR